MGTPEQLLRMILEADRGEQLRLCRNAVNASIAANTCFLAGHDVEIDNLKRAVVDLSAALLAAVRGEMIDPVMIRSAENAACGALSTAE